MKGVLAFLAFGFPGDAPPTEFLLFPMGEHTSEKGPFVFDSESAKTVMEAWERKGKKDIPVDYEHNMVNGETTRPGDQIAAAWFKPEVRADGLWAVDVRWTDRARSFLTAKEYRYHSPAFYHVDGHITELINVALTNTPAQHDQTPLVAAKDDKRPTKEQPTMKSILATLKLAESSSEAEAVHALIQLQTERARLLEATGKGSVAEAMGVLTAWKTSADQLREVEQKLVVLQNEARQRKVDRLVKQGVRERKISPAMVEHFTKVGMEKDGTKFLAAFLESAQPLVEKKPHKEQPRDGSHQSGLTADQKLIAQKLGISEVAFAKQLGTAKE